jgi:hypothetical protein
MALGEVGWDCGMIRAVIGPNSGGRRRGSDLRYPRTFGTPMCCQPKPNQRLRMLLEACADRQNVIQGG